MLIKSTFCLIFLSTLVSCSTGTVNDPVTPTAPINPISEPKPETVNSIKERVHIVKKGAFLLSVKKDIRVDGNLKHSLISYLPVGTLVTFPMNMTKTTIFNERESKDEEYYLVHTSTGEVGYLRYDLSDEVSSDVIVVALTEKRIPLLNEYSFKREEYFSRSLGGYMVVMSGATDKYVKVSRPMDKNTIFLINRKYFSANLTKMIYRNKLLKFYKHIRKTKNSKNVEIDGLVSYLREKIGSSAENLKEHLDYLMKYQCDIEGSVIADAGAKFWGSGLGIKIKYELFKKNHALYFGQLNFSKPNDLEDYYFTLKDIKCVDGNPYRLNRITIISSLFSAKNNLTLSLAELEKSIKLNQWDTNLAGHKFKKKMVVIDGYESYTTLLTYLENQAKSSSYLSSLTPERRLFALHLIISEISYFKNPKS